MEPHIRNGLIFVLLSAVAGIVLYLVFAWNNDRPDKDAVRAEQGTTISSDAANTKCSTNDIAITLPKTSEQGGTLEIITPIVDTDGLNVRKVVVVGGRACVTLRQLEILARDGGVGSNDMEVVFAHDPQGTTDYNRSFLNFLPDPGDPEPTISTPPSDMLFGRAIWKKGSTARSLAVRWIDGAEAVERGAPQILYGISDEDSGAKDYQACLDNSGGVTSNMLDCMGNELDRVDALLNSAYREKIATLSKDDADALRQRQRRWIATRDAKCDDQAQPEAGGTLASIIYRGCLVEETTARISWLEDYQGG